jgi:hypothetical protein
MKKLLLLLLLTAGIYGQTDRWVQTDTLIAGTDSLVVDTLKGFTKYSVLSVKDTGSTYTDTVFVEVYDKMLATWIRIGVRNLLDYTDYQLASPGAGVDRMYLILFPAGSKDIIIRQRLGNAQYVAGRRVLTSLRQVNNY